MAIVEVRPVPRDKWHGKKGKESFSQPHSYEVLYDTVKGGWANGLTEEEEVSYGKQLGVNLSKSLPAAMAHPYYSTQAAFIKLPNHTMTFNTDNAAEAVKVKAMKESRFIANSLKEWQDGLYEDATHFIYDESEEAEAKATKFQKRVELMGIISGMSDDQKVSLIQIVGDKTVRGQSKNYIDGVLATLVEDPTKVEDLLFYAKADKAKLYARATVLEAIHRRVLVKDGATVSFKGDRIGMDVDDATTFLLDDANQKYKVAILAALNTGIVGGKVK